MTKRLSRPLARRHPGTRWSARPVLCAGALVIMLAVLPALFNVCDVTCGIEIADARPVPGSSGGVAGCVDHPSGADPVDACSHPALTALLSGRPGPSDAFDTTPLPAVAPLASIPDLTPQQVLLRPPAPLPGWVRAPRPALALPLLL